MLDKSETLIWKHNELIKGMCKFRENEHVPGFRLFIYQKLEQVNYIDFPTRRYSAVKPEAYNPEWVSSRENELDHSLLVGCMLPCIKNPQTN